MMSMTIEYKVDMLMAQSRSPAQRQNLAASWPIIDTILACSWSRRSVPFFLAQALNNFPAMAAFQASIQLCQKERIASGPSARDSQPTVDACNCLLNGCLLLALKILNFLLICHDIRPKERQVAATWLNEALQILSQLVPWVAILT